MNEEKILHDEALDEDSDWAFWFDGKNINEIMFCQYFLQLHPMKCVRGRLFTVDGIVEDEGEISQMILDEVRGCLTNGVAKAVSNLLASLKLMAYSPPLPVETDRIHVANGTYFLNGTFTEDKTYCNNRLKVAYNPNAPQPKRWLHFLSDLLVPEDIPTLQEYLGYCLIPSTKGQKMLMLIGKGGEGKSRIGLVMRSILGDSMNTTSIQKIENNRFSRADLENKLLMVDDDMDMSALPKTNYIKSIVTAECKMDLERKGVQSYQSLLYARFLCFGNGALTALHDQSDGFFRRQIVLTTKERPADRLDDPFLAEKLMQESEGIFLWCMEGLYRLLANNYRFTISGQARENVETVKRSSNNVIEFLQSEGYIRFKADSEASSKAIYHSAASLNEMGAAWAMKQKWSAILLPGFGFGEISGCIDPSQISIKLDDSDATTLKYRLGELKDMLTSEFGLRSMSPAIWERKRDDFLNKIAGLSNSQEPKNEPVQEISKSQGMGKSSNQISIDACIMLAYAADDPHGQILRCAVLSGTSISTNKVSFIKSGTAREIARWTSALDELSNKGYVNCEGRGEIFIVTNAGYILADQVKKEFIENIEEVFSECYRILKPGGIFYYSIVHPAFYDSEWIKDKKGFCYAKSISSYIEPYSYTNEFWGKTEHFHRSLGRYLNIAAEQGFILRHVEEPVSYDGITKNKDLPLFFFAEYKKE